MLNYGFLKNLCPHERKGGEEKKEMGEKNGHVEFFTKVLKKEIYYV